MLFEKIVTIKDVFREKVTLYGKRVAIIIVLKALLQKLFRITWQKCYLMSCPLNDVYLPPARDDIMVRKLTLSDYENELWHNFLTEKKRTIYKARFNNNRTIAYGAFIGETLAYSTWISYGEVTYSETEVLLKQDDCALLLDTYCHPQFRGCGLHNYMNQWCLYKMKECGARKAYVIVLSYNRPAIKTQKKCGLEVEKTFYVWNFGKWQYITYKSGNENNG